MWFVRNPSFQKSLKNDGDSMVDLPNGSSCSWARDPVYICPSVKLPFDRRFPSGAESPLLCISSLDIFCIFDDLNDREERESLSQRPKSSSSSSGSSQSEWKSKRGARWLFYDISPYKYILNLFANDHLSGSLSSWRIKDSFPAHIHHHQI